MPIDINTEMTSPQAPHSVSRDEADLRGAGYTAGHPGAAHATPARTRSMRGLWILLAIILLLLAVGIALGIAARSRSEHTLTQTTRNDAVMTVSVVHPTVTGISSEVALPGNTQAFNDTPIYARTNGYLKQWFTDIGAHVRRGQLMAIIETPEVDEQLQVAQANVKSAQADLELAKTTSERYQNLLKQDSVSRQETDVAVSGAAAKEAALDAAEANVRRLKELQSFERVYAPFDGVVTARNTDIGALINAGGGTSQPHDLFRIASINQLRVFVPVPEVYAPAIQNGSTATLTLDEYPGQQFKGVVTRNSSAIDPTNRTLNVEVDVANADRKLLPGSYVFVHFKLPHATQMLSVPADTLLFRAEGPRVGVVRGGHVHLQPVTIGRDHGSTLEIATGLTGEDQVIVNPADSISEGQPVRIASSKANSGSTAD